MEGRPLRWAYLYLLFPKKCVGFEKCLKKLDIETSTLVFTESRCRARGLLLVCRQELEQKVQINNYLPRCGRRETLEILVDKRPGDRQGTQIQKEETQHQKEETCHMESVQTKWQQGSTKLEQQPQRQLVSWPKCFGRGICLTLPPSPRSIDNPPSPLQSPFLSSDSSGPPSLESITGPELGYKASLSSDTE